MKRSSLITFALLAVVAPCFGSTRIKDITSVQGVRGNQLVGYGLVIGLNGSGDSLRNAPFTAQSVQSMLDKMGVNVRNSTAKTKNAAAVIVTTELAPFAGRGSKVDVTVSSLGDATSLAGGSLIMTPLTGADGTVYAVAQGPVAVSGFSVGGKAETVTQGVPTSGRIANGALVEREIATHFTDQKSFTLELYNPDFSTATRMADVINAYTQSRYNGRAARAKDLRAVELYKPPSISVARFMSEIGELFVEPDAPARIVIDERTGTIVIGKDVQISTVAVSHGNLTVRVTEAPKVSQPLPFSKGETAVVPRTAVDVSEAGGSVVTLNGSSLQSLVSGLNKMGLKPQGIIAILQAIKSAGALQAELVVQ